MFWRIAVLLFFCPLVVTAQKKAPLQIQVNYTTGHPVNRFRPSETIGAAFDGHWGGETEKILTPANVEAMKSIGLKPISYRLRTELGDEAWHWNPKGTWSEAAQQQGYWTSDATPGAPIQLSFGYRLPRRGNTHDNANDNGYSKIDDGDTNTFWKSNPYLGHHFTHEADSLHPQWVVVDLGRSLRVNALRIHWGEPYALSYRLDYAGDNGNDYFEPYQPGIWHPLKKSIGNKHGGSDLVTISGKPVSIRYLKITMDQSSYTGSGNDIRDRIGFAIREIELGLLENNRFHDLVKHSPDQHQSVLRVSSTDPWHRASDLDPNTEQAGIDRFYSSGITSGLPTMLPIGLLYDTPDNMTAFIRYIQQKKYSVSELEMGEEPEGQLIHPGDYAALYLQFATAIRKLTPGLRLGGPGFAALAKDDAEDAYTFSERQWTQLFINYLERHKALDLFNFFSFEWYPFDDVCAPAGPQLLAQPALLRAALKPFTEHILPHGLPIYITEYGYSAYGGEAEVRMEGGLMYADILGQFLALGGGRSFLYGLEPAYLEETNNCTWGNNMLLAMGDDSVEYRTAAFYTMRMMTQVWMREDSLLEVYPVTVADPSVTAYALLRPNGIWSIALINKSATQARTVNVSIREGKHSETLFLPLHLVQYGQEKYHWKANGADGHPDRALPPKEKLLRLPSITLPPYSLTIVEEVTFRI